MRKSKTKARSRDPDPGVDGLGNPIAPDGWYFIQDARPGATVGNCATWWRPEGAGYTCDLSDAGIYRGVQILRARETDVPWPVNYVREHAVTHVRADAAALDYQGHRRDARRSILQGTFLSPLGRASRPIHPTARRDARSRVPEGRGRG